MNDLIFDTITRHGMFSRGDNVVLGLSGGADSMCLLHVLTRLRHDLDLRLVCAHIHHGIREASGQEETFVRARCEAAGVPLCVYHVDTPAHAAALKTGTEAAARDLRYQCFELCGRDLDGDFKIATAHTHSDNVETVLMRFLRGAGSLGLGGIWPKRGNIVRPLITVTRAQVLAYNTRHGITYVQDESNADNSYTRNKLRNELLPQLTRDFNPNIADTITRTAELTRDDNDYIESHAQAALEQCTATREPGAVTLHIPRLLAAHPAVTRRVVRLAVHALRGSATDISAAHVQAALDIAGGHTGRRADIGGGLCAEKSYDSLRLGTPAQAPSGFAHTLVYDSPAYIAQLQSYVLLSRRKPGNMPPHAQYAAFAADAHTPVTLRTRRPGDIFGSKKLKDHFIDTKTPRADRGLIPLIAQGHVILWVLNARGETSRKHAPAPHGHTAVPRGETLHITIWRHSHEPISEGSRTTHD
ncbi:MAG: tRNA lysidine(34) synthetase TilS [Defluviitaleaceae bacterium]|nr:tRNA lysidine(34) synthetase TilS [Defluviitaleaceae bacterium]